METTEDRRNHKRYRVREGAFAVHSLQLGPVTDIGMGGLAFEYICIGESVPESSRLDIFMSNSAFHLKGIPVHTVSDVDMHTQSPFQSYMMRRCSVAFENLTDENELLMRRFIEANTVGEK